MSSVGQVSRVSTRKRPLCLRTNVEREPPWGMRAETVPVPYFGSGRRRCLSRTWARRRRRCLSHTHLGTAVEGGLVGARWRSAAESGLGVGACPVSGPSRIWPRGAKTVPVPYSSRNSLPRRPGRCLSRTPQNSAQNSAEFRSRSPHSSFPSIRHRAAAPIPLPTVGVTSICQSAGRSRR